MSQLPQFYTQYKTFNDAQASLVNKVSSTIKPDLHAIMLNAHMQLMEESSLYKNSLRMPFFVFSNQQYEHLLLLTNTKIKRIADFNPAVEALFTSLTSQSDIDTYFNLWFAPRGGIATDYTAKAFQVAGNNISKTVELLYPLRGLSLNELINEVNKLSVYEYAMFYTAYASALDTFIPGLIDEGIKRGVDYLNDILANPLNFMVSSKINEMRLANTALILEALSQPKTSLVFQSEYTKNLDLSLYTRLKQADIVEDIPNLPRLDVTKVIDVWRHNAQVKLGDLNAELKNYPQFPEGSKFDLLKVAVAIVAVALVAPYAASYVTSTVKLAATKISALGSAAMTKTGELATIATGKAVDEKITEIKTGLLEQEKETIISDKSENQKTITASQKTIHTNQAKPNEGSLLTGSLFIAALLLSI